jgi:hypothetical protein
LARNLSLTCHILNSENIVQSTSKLKHCLIKNEDIKMKWHLLLIGLVALPSQAQTTYYSDAMGLPLGTANKIGNTTYYSDANGLPLGTANRVGNTTYYNNANGLPLGTAQTPQTVAPIQNYAPSYSTPPAPIFPTAPLFPTSPRGM